MRLDAVTAEIRPRSDWEAVDLGLALARRDFWRCLAVWWLAVLLPTVVAEWFLWDSPLLWLLLFWWWKPAASRMVLFELSRRLFGERPTWRESLRMIPGAWRRRFVYRFLWMRLAPWLPVTMAVEELEGLRGEACKQRCQQLKRRGDGVVMWIYMISDLTAVWLGIKETWFVVDRTLAYIGGVFTGREAADQVGGPLRIAQISGQVATIGLAALVHLAAVLSISIGLLNLFPVPLLDGGHLLFYGVEAVRGRPLSERAQEMGFRIGLGLVLMLMVFATYNDILHLAAS